MKKGQLQMLMNPIVLSIIALGLTGYVTYSFYDEKQIPPKNETPGPVPDTTNDILFGACPWNGWSSSADFSRIASAYSMLSMNEKDNSYAAKLKQENPDILILMYKHIGCNDQWSDHGSCLYSEVNNVHNDWFLTRNGQRIIDPYFGSSPKVYYFDLSRSDVRRYMADRYVNTLKKYGKTYDGLWVDLAPASLSYYGGSTDQIKTDQAAYDSYKAYLIDVRDALHAAGYIWIPEWSEMSQDNNWRSLIQYTDGAWDEAFYYDWQGNTRPQSDINRQIEDCKETVRQGKIYGAGLWLNRVPSTSEVQKPYDALKQCGSGERYLFAPGGNYKVDIVANSISPLQGISR